MLRTLIYKIDDKIGVATIFSYLIIGGLSAAINFLVFAFFYNYLGFHYKIAVTISYLIAVVFNFISNRYFTFKSGGRHIVRHFYRYLTMLLLNYTITLVTLHVIVEWLSLSAYLGLLVSIGITAFTGFSLSKFWVFADHENKVGA